MMERILQVGDRFTSSKCGSGASVVYRVESALMQGGSGSVRLGHGAGYPDGWYIGAKSDDGSTVIAFYQSGCFNNMIKPSDVVLVEGTEETDLMEEKPPWSHVDIMILNGEMVLLFARQCATTAHARDQQRNVPLGADAKRVGRLAAQYAAADATALGDPLAAPVVLREHVDKAVAALDREDLTAHWYLGDKPEDTRLAWLPAYLRQLADAVEGAHVDPADVEQALFSSDGYEVRHVIADARNGSSEPVIQALEKLGARSRYVLC